MSEENRPEGPGKGYHEEVQHSPATARIPEKVSPGVFSTGTIVMHGPHEFVIDFLQSLAHPRRVAARVVLPPTVIPPFLGAMQDNFAKYTQMFGPLPRMPQPRPATPPREAGEGEPGGKPGGTGGGAGGSGGGAGQEATPFPLNQPDPTPPKPATPSPMPISEVYEHLKLPDEMLSGVYANTVVISHTGAEFCFDFITSFFPRSAVAARIYMACPHVVEFSESLTRSWEQFRSRQR
jgi:hypothetical protein